MNKKRKRPLHKRDRNQKQSKNDESSDFSPKASKQRIKQNIYQKSTKMEIDETFSNMKNGGKNDQSSKYHKISLTPNN